MKKFLYGICILVIAAVVFACFSPWRGEGGNLVISFGNSSRAADGAFARWWSDVKKYEVILQGPGGTIRQEFDGGATVAPQDKNFSVIPGTWNVMIKGVGTVMDGSGTSSLSSYRLIAMGMDRVVVGSGKKTLVNIKMKSAAPAGDETDLNNYITGNYYDPNYIQNSTSWKYYGDGEYYILITKSFQMGTGINLIGNTERKIILVAEDDVTITKSSAISFFDFSNTIPSQLTLGMPGMTGTLTFDGGNISSVNAAINLSNNAAHKLIMNEGVTIKNNVNSSNGGAVNVSFGCEFTMNGGTITGNKAIGSGTAGNGGGVYVVGTFRINSPATTGSIYGNTATGTGNNVYVNSGATFTVNGVPHGNY